MNNVNYKSIKGKVKAEPEEKKGYVRDFITGQWLKSNPEEGPRQIMLKRLVEEYGYDKNDIEIEVKIKKGSQLIGPADIVIFQKNKPHNQDYIEIIVECKKPERRDGITQLKTYMAPTKSVKYGVWFNGKDIVYLRATDKEPVETFGVPKFGETLGLPRKADLRPFTELSKRFEVIHNYIYANEGLRNDETFDEILRLLFMKIQDEKDNRSSFVLFGVSGEEFDLIRDGKENKTDFRERIEKLFEETKERFKDIFRRGESISLKTYTLAWVVGQLQDFSLLNSKIDVKGAAFQKFVYHHQRGDRGEFFTPDPIIDLVVKFLDPSPEQKVIDPACGTGRFLTETMRYVWDKYFEYIPVGPRKWEAKLDYALNNLRGIDFNPTVAKIAKMRMVLMDDGHTGIFSANSLEEWNILGQVARESEVKGGVKPNSFDLVMTNPPFGSKGRVQEKRVLEQFDLARKWQKQENGKWQKTNTMQNAQVPDILFIERCLDFLKEGGKMAILLPDGDLTNSTLAFARQFVKEKARILAVVSLPKETFIPHGAGVKASILFLQKLSERNLEKLQKQDYPVFFGIIEKIGYEGDKTGLPTYKRDENGEIVKDKTGEPILDEDVSEVIAAWQNFKKKNL